MFAASKLENSAVRHAHESHLPSHRIQVGLPISPLSIVIPVLNEADNVEPLAREISRAVGATDVEIIFVDDGSSDETVEKIASLRREIPQIRLLCHGSRRGQSAALRTGIQAARAEWVATLDGDGQNDPADIPKLARIAAQTNGAVRLIIGYRHSRKDTWLRRMASRIANAVRRSLLHDDTPDSGCGLKLIHRETFLLTPYFDHMHRFLPALFRREGVGVISVPVHHRPRTCGRSKYGIFDRLWVGVTDLFGVWWLIRRAPPHAAVRES